MVVINAHAHSDLHTAEPCKIATPTESSGFHAIARMAGRVLRFSFTAVLLVSFVAIGCPLVYGQSTQSELQGRSICSSLYVAI